MPAGLRARQRPQSDRCISPPVDRFSNASAAMLRLGKPPGRNSPGAAADSDSPSQRQTVNRFTTGRRAQVWPPPGPSCFARKQNLARLDPAWSPAPPGPSALDRRRRAAAGVRPAGPTSHGAECSLARQRSSIRPWPCASARRVPAGRAGRTRSGDRPNESRPGRGRSGGFEPWAARGGSEVTTACRTPRGRSPARASGTSLAQAGPRPWGGAHAHGAVRGGTRTGRSCAGGLRVRPHQPSPPPTTTTSAPQVSPRLRRRRCHRPASCCTTASCPCLRAS
jgi:hypothetical protein